MKAMRLLNGLQNFLFDPETFASRMSRDFSRKGGSDEESLRSGALWHRGDCDHSGVRGVAARYGKRRRNRETDAFAARL